jgi:acid phosphatase
MTHDSLLIVTWDEDGGGSANRIATIFVGQRVRPGRYRSPIDHYNVLRTIEQAYGLPYRGQAATHYPITGIWSPPG